MSQTTLKIAIIGGGISGLSTAYYLRKQAGKSQAKLDIHIYERSQVLGGNADTVVVDLGERYGAQGPTGRYVRWADLGVNDVNLATYHRLQTLMQEVGYLDRMLPLQDTESYFSLDGSVLLTDDSNLQYGVSDTSKSLQHADHGLLAPLIKVVHLTALNALGKVSVDYTVGQFFQDCIDDPRAMLSQAAEELHIGIDWQDPALAQRMATVRDTIYFPRISAMYFTDDQGPQGMPLRAPFEYYRIQEGGVTPDRRYFNHGSQTWLEHLANDLLKHSNEQVRISIHTDTDVEVMVGTGSVVIHDRNGSPQTHDLCVVTTHADDARELFSFDDSVTRQYHRIDAILASVRYTKSYAVCHTHSASLPPNKHSWRTYNIQVRDRGDSFTPYRISYVVNLHQNDPAQPQYDHAGLPQFFISLVDNLNAIPRQAMLNRVLDRASVPSELLAQLPRATLDQMDGATVDSGYSGLLDHVSEPLRSKAWTYFKHNVLDATCIRAQEAMLAYNKEVAAEWSATGKATSPVLFGGGWTQGAGLHEQCLEQSECISQWILP